MDDGGVCDRPDDHRARSGSGVHARADVSVRQRTAAAVFDLRRLVALCAVSVSCLAL